jgi:hypothetical protein
MKLQRNHLRDQLSESPVAVLTGSGFKSQPPA